VLEVLRGYAAQHGGFAVTSPIDIVFSDYDVIQPDVVFFRRERQHLIDLDAPIRQAPDLCVEVLSPSTAATDRGRKMRTDSVASHAFSTRFITTCCSC
jgi:Uma2 family endonuclease